MAVDGSDQKNQDVGSGDLEQPDQNNPRVRNLHDGIQSGTTCHQCRQKILKIAAVCKNMKKKNKRCTIKLYDRCLLRYREKAEEVALRDDWTCPKCLGICNCSICMTSQGNEPTGRLIHAAKSEGFSSVSDLLRAKGSEIVTKKLPASSEGGVVASPKKLVGENHLDGTCNAASEPREMDVVDKVKRERLTKTSSLEESANPQEAYEAKMKHSDDHDVVLVEERKEVEITLPHGTGLINVAGVDLPGEDVDNVLKFL